MCVGSEQEKDKFFLKMPNRDTGQLTDFLEKIMSCNYKVKTYQGKMDWTVEVPGSKSMTNRALLMAALADGETTLKGVLFSDDSRHFLQALKDLGFFVDVREEDKTVVVRGEAGAIPVHEGEIYVGSAGTAARFLTAMLGFSDGSYVIQASEQMKKRPMRPLFDVLTAVGAKITYLEQEGFLPIRIVGAGTGKEMAQLDLDISKSTQFLSALLLIAPMKKNGIRIHITSEKTDGSYIRITRKMMENFGAEVSFDGRDYEVAAGTSYQAGEYQIEPDVSAACYFYAAAAILCGSALVKNVTNACMQGDLKFLTVLEEMGCRIEETEAGIRVTGPECGRLKGICVQMNDFSDQALTLAAIAPFADSDVRMEGIGHIRLQECDRLHAMATELQRLGITCEEEADAITIHPGRPKPAVIETYDDHRVAMAFSLVGLRTEGIEISNPQCCKKTFETYFEVLDALTK